MITFIALKGKMDVWAIAGPKPLPVSQHHVQTTRERRRSHQQASSGWEPVSHAGWDQPDHSPFQCTGWQTRSTNSPPTP